MRSRTKRRQPTRSPRSQERWAPTPVAARTAAAWLAPVALLCFGSGACGLVYQTVWLRELRLILGGSTQATATVLAVFMGGLGVGATLIGPRVDRDPRPLRLYGLLELGIAATAAATPALAALARAIYFAAGGAFALGPVLGSALRAVLAVLVLSGPAVLMGGTLPAVARVVGGPDDPRRRRVAALYAVNTLGAVAGTVAAAFFLLEHLGARGTVLVTAAGNALLGATALLLALRAQPIPDLAIAPASGAPPTSVGVEPPARALVLPIAGITGAAFLLMEIVWYRLLAPILGGTTFTFALILAVALAGIGIGGAAFARRRRRAEVTAATVGLACALQALGLAIPFALGDRLALLAMVLRPIGQLGFGGFVAGWAIVTAIVVLPAAIASGFQFPALLALLGRGRHAIARDTGTLYAVNTSGAIAGSLLGGFGLLPLLTAPGVWRVTAALLASIAIVTLLLGRRGRRGAGVALAGSTAALVAVALVTFAVGPTPAWRHSGIGAGKHDGDDVHDPNAAEKLVQFYRRSCAWQADGRESSVAVMDGDGYSLIVNGKSDGNAIDDGGTQVMLGLTGALLTPAPRRALVIGLGTGSTAGWLARVPSMKRVDVVELEPVVQTVARLCAPANQDALDDPKVRLHLGDGHEFLLTDRNRYDLIASEPSNPYRAGVASFYTREFYAAAERRLAPGGLFLQWVQAYEIDVRTLRTVYATMHSVFPHVETWATLNDDLLLVASRDPITADVATLRQRLATEPFATAVRDVWRTGNLEGVAAHYVGNEGLAEFFARGTPLDTDDRLQVEYGFARALASHVRVSSEELHGLALAMHVGWPHWAGANLDTASVIHQRAAETVAEGAAPVAPPAGSVYRPLVVAMAAYHADNSAGARQALAGYRGSLDNETELAVVADALADAGDSTALGALSVLAQARPAEAGFVLARLRYRQGRPAQAVDAYVRACEEYRRDPWVWSVLAQRALPMGPVITAGDRTLARRVFDALGEPFAASRANDLRLHVRFQVAEIADGPAPGECVREALEPFAAHPSWQEGILSVRADCYRRLGDPRAAAAQRDLERFRANRVPNLGESIQVANR